MPEGKQPTIVGRKPLEGCAEVQQVRGQLGLGLRSLRNNEAAHALPPKLLTSLVCGDRDDPRLRACRIAERIELPPDLASRCLCGVLRVLWTAAQQPADAENIGVIGGDQGFERLDVALARPKNHRSNAVDPCDLHTL